jgi:hypothetical protein
VQNVSHYELLYSTLKEKKSDPHVTVPGQETINFGDHLNKDCIIMGPEAGQMLALADVATSELFSSHPTSILGVGACQLDLIHDEDGELR